MIFTTNLTGDDLARWRKLVRIAGHCASHPRASAVELGRAAKRVTKARVPGALSRENPAVQLMTAASKYAAYDAIGRAANAPELADLVVEARRLMERVAPVSPSEPEPEPAGRRFRADLDG